MPEYDSTVSYRDIPGSPGYKVGSDGTVWTSRKNKPWTELAKAFVGAGYHVVNIVCGDKQKNQYVHRLVLEAFVGPCPEGMECRHFPDRDKTNNWIANLQWGTKKSNMADMDAHGTRKVGEDCNFAKLTKVIIIEIRRLHKNGMMQRSIADKFGISRASVCLIVNRRQWKHV